jgi:very-short-patch-repair endonuclease
MSNPKDQPNKKIEVWSRSKIPDSILGYAREMRKDPTESEAILWNSLRGRKLNKLKFRRQQPFKGYILDFYCEEVRLGVEVDGEIHLNQDQKKYDQLRTDFLAEYGIKIIRFTNDQVINKMKEVLNSIKE